MRNILAGLMFMVGTGGAWSQSGELAELAARTLEASGAPAVGVLSLDDGEHAIGVAGLRAFRGDARVGEDDLWHMGSNTKAMTAVLVARLVERGVISWDDTVTRHLGAHIEDIDASYGEVTFLHLLTHRSGLRANVNNVDMIRFGIRGASDEPITQQRLDYARRVLTETPQGAAETDFLYSNAGYVVVGAMLEAVTGESWESLMQREVFEPLGLESAGFGAPGSSDAVDQPRGHRAGMFGGLTAVEPGPAADNPPVLGPAGTAHMNLSDLADYLDVVMAGMRGEESDFLSVESWQRIATPPFGGDYALGWGVQGDQRLHAGSNTMWFVQIVIEPDTGSGAVVAFNDGRINRLQPAMVDAVRTLME